MRQNSAVPLQKSHNMTTPEELCMLTVTTSVGHCKTENGGKNSQRSTITDVLLPSCS